MKLFEISAAERSSFWVAADSAAEVQKAIADTGATLVEESQGLSLLDADYTLPAQAMSLASALLQKASDHRNHNRPIA